AGWPTPMAGTPAQNGNNAAGNNDSSRKTVELAGWPTPMTGTNRKSEKAMRAHAEGGQSSPPGLEQQAQMAGWPTPVKADHWGPSTPESAQREWDQKNLRGIAAQLAGWPTPSTMDGGNTGTAWEARRAEQKAMGRNGNGFGLILTLAAS